MISTSIKTPLIIERNKTQTLSFPIFEDGVALAPASGTITIYDEDSVAVVSAAAVTVSAGIATYSLSSSLIPVTKALSDLWLIEWSLVSSGVTYTFRQEACLSLRLLFPVLSEDDITSRHFNISKLVSSQKPISTYIEEAWNVINAKLFSQGKRPYLIMSSWALREVHLFYTLSLIFRDLETNSQGAGKYQDLANFYMDSYNKEWDKLSFKYDYGEENKPGTAETQTGVPVIYLQGR